MLLLDAINRLLVSTGESEITVLDSTHPLQAVATSVINKVSNRKQMRGWWFNTRTVTLAKATTGAATGKIAVPATYTAVQPVRGVPYVMRSDATLGGILFDMSTGLDVADASVEVDIIERLAFERLPESFADWAATGAALSFASTYDADPTKLSLLKEELGTAYVIMNTEHIRMSKFNFFEVGSTARSLAINQGQRYGVRFGR